VNTRNASVTGLAFWTPRLPGWSVAAPVLRGEAPPLEQPATRPSPATLAPTERRRAPDTVAVALEVAAGACASAGVDPKAVASVFATTHADLAISDYMCDTLAKTPTLISPTRFHKSVHNAAAGYWTIGTGCCEPYTALTAYEDSFGEALLEALAQAECSGRPTLLVAYDIEARGPLATMAPSRGIVGVGVVVTPGETTQALARIGWRTVRGSERTPPLERNAALVAGNAMAGCLPFVEAIALVEPRVVRLGLSPTCLLEVEFEIPVKRDRSRS
jgi:hypothetical protein